MRGRILRRPSPAMVVACLALFLTLGGVGYAAATINGGSIKKGTITPSKIKNRSLSGTQIRGNGIGGPSIKESTLGQVPSAKAATTATSATNSTNATTAKNANELGGVAASSYLRRGQPIAGGQTVAGVFNCTVPSSTVCRNEITLPAPAPTGLVSTTVNFAPTGIAGFTAGDQDTACTGNPNTPTAPAGVVCLYLAQNNGAAAVTGVGNAVGGAVGTLGFEVLVTPNAPPGVVDVVGVWAYTAP